MALQFTPSEEKKSDVIQAEATVAEDTSKTLNLNIAEPQTYSIVDTSNQLKQELAQEIKGGLELRPTKKVQGGFRLASKDGSGYFDCSDEEISKMLMPFFRDIHL